jgi:hypothetical protein
LVVTETGTHWATGFGIGLPGDADGPGNQLAQLFGVSCSSPGNCVAVGWYFSTAVAYVPVIETESGNVWGSAIELALPSNQRASDPHGSLAGVVCTSSVVCTAVGSYFDSNGTPEPLAVTSSPYVAPPTLSVSTASLPPAVGGAPYSAQLSAFGGTGGDTWAVSAGALPAGLTLNTATGVISGTPTAVGTGNFTISVTDSGSPAQVASVALSIAVAAPPAPSTVLSSTKLSTKHGHHTAKFNFGATGNETSFECALVKLPKGKHKRPPKPSYAPCVPPKTYKNLKAATYVFYVRAVGLGGIDQTPARHKFTVS